MKKLKLTLLVAIFAIFTLSLTACDAAAIASFDALELEAKASSQSSAQTSSYSRGAEDDNYFNSSNNSRSTSSELRFKGTVEDVTADTITINGETFSVNTAQDLTTIFTVGDMFEIEYRFNQDGTISISQIHSENSQNDLDIEFKGMVEAVTADTLSFGGETFTVVTLEDLTTLFTAGQFYEIKYLLNDDGTISILSFHSEDDSSDMDIEFKGLVEAVTVDTISFGGETYFVDTLDDLTTLFTAGQTYEIKYILNEDGSITILDFHLEDGPNDMSDDSSNNMDDSSNSSNNSGNNSNDDSNNNNSNNDNNNDDSNDNSNNNDDDNDNSNDDD